MMNLLFASSPNMNGVFSQDAIGVFNEGLKVMGLGMTTVIGILIVFFLLIKLLIKLFPDKE